MGGGPQLLKKASAMIDAGAPIETFEEIDSTLVEARRRAERGDFGPVWLIARRQTAGRGRRGRAWASLDGNLLATLLFSTTRAPAQLALLGFAAALAIAETLESWAPAARATLKWPNDVLLDGAKAAGVLLDSGAAEAGRAWAALAFGVNLAAAPAGLDQPATCLRRALPPDAPAPSPLVFFAALRPRLERLASQLAAEGFAPLRQAWLLRAHGMGEIARVHQGEQIIEGRIAGISSRGELELDTQSGRRLIAAGDVYFSSAA